MAQFETKRYGLECKADTEKRLIKGYASIFNNVDSDGDLIEKGAFAKSIAEKFTPGGSSRIKMMSQHKTFIGLPTVMKEDDRGLYVEGKASKTPAGDEALELVADGVWDEMSFGFVTLREERVNDDDEHGGKLRRILKELDIWEFGPLAWGANSQTTAEAEKSGWLLDTLHQIKEGRVLSKANLDRLTKAMELIEEVVAAGDTSEDEAEDQGKAEAGVGQSKKDQMRGQAVELLTGITAEIGQLAQTLKR